jgi:hypothetical protein
VKLNSLAETTGTSPEQTLVSTHLKSRGAEAPDPDPIHM